MPARIVGRLTEVEVHRLRQLQLPVRVLCAAYLFYLHGIDVHHAIAELLVQREGDAPVGIGEDDIAYQYMVVIAVIAVGANALSRHLVSACPAIVATERE